MKILFILPYSPIPTNTGNKNLTFNLLKYLDQKAKVDIVIIEDLGNKMEAKEKNKKENNENVGSSENQISIFSKRIKNLTEHLKSNKKDHNTRRGLMKLVGKRKKLLTYLKGKSNDRYESIIKSLGLRR